MMHKNIYNSFMVIMGVMSLYIGACLLETPYLNFNEIDSKVMAVLDVKYDPVPIRYNAGGKLIVKRGQVVVLQRTSKRYSNFQAIASRIVSESDGSEHIIEMIKRPPNYASPNKPTISIADYAIPYSVKDSCDVSLYTVLEIYSNYNLYVSLLRPTLYSTKLVVCVE